MEYKFNETSILQLHGDLAIYNSWGFLIDFSYNKSQNQKAINALKQEQWLDHNTRAIVIAWTVGSAWTNAYYNFQILIETPGNNIFKTSHKIETVYLTIASKDN